MSGDRLRLIDPAHARNYLTLRERRAMGERIDALGVDRSAIVRMALARWSEDAERHGERQREADRQEVTMAERMAAWRKLFQLTQRHMQR